MVVSLSVFGVAIGNSLTSVYSIGIAASFIFKNAASSAFDAIMFIFVTQYIPFHVPVYSVANYCWLVVLSILVTVASSRTRT